MFVLESTKNHVKMQEKTTLSTHEKIHSLENITDLNKIIPSGTTPTSTQILFNLYRSIKGPMSGSILDIDYGE